MDEDTQDRTEQDGPVSDQPVNELEPCAAPITPPPPDFLTRRRRRNLRPARRTPPPPIIYDRRRPESAPAVDSPCAEWARQVNLTVIRQLSVFVAQASCFSDYFCWINIVSYLLIWRGWSDEKIGSWSQHWMSLDSYVTVGRRPVSEYIEGSPNALSLVHTGNWRLYTATRPIRRDYSVDHG